ncbi:MAG: ubiquinol-cytochrome C chaperone family protein [Pontixanthobacter sp.]
MSFLSRLFGTAPDPKEEIRPFYSAIIGAARQPVWYLECGACDTIDGRFDMITNIMAMVMLRMESEPALMPASARLTELLVEDLDGQLRETGLGDPTLGKKMGKLMEAMGGRLGAYRTALAEGRPSMIEAVRRNINLVEGAQGDAMADRLIAFSATLAALPDAQLLRGEFTA